MSNNSGVEFFAGLVIGGLVGAALSMLLAPQSGEETRAQLRDKSLEWKDRAEEGVLEARHQAEKQVAGLQSQISTLQNQVADLQEKGVKGATEALNKGKEAVNKTVGGNKS